MLMSYTNRFTVTGGIEYIVFHAYEDEPPDLSHVYGWLMVLCFALADLFIIREALK
jgi:hypothetical protein